MELGVSSGIFLPPEGGRLGFALAGDASYGVPLGRAYLAPGVRVASFIRSGLVAIAPLVTTRVGAHVDLFRGTVDPYLLGGVGVGHLSESSHEGFAYQFGGGVTASVGARLSVGAELVYLGIVGSDFRALFLGPRVTLAL